MLTLILLDFFEGSSLSRLKIAQKVKFSNMIENQRLFFLFLRSQMMLRCLRHQKHILSDFFCTIQILRSNQYIDLISNERDIEEKKIYIYIYISKRFSAQTRRLLLVLTIHSLTATPGPGRSVIQSYGLDAVAELQYCIFRITLSGQSPSSPRPSPHYHITRSVSSPQPLLMRWTPSSSRSPLPVPATPSQNPRSYDEVTFCGCQNSVTFD